MTRNVARVVFLAGMTVLVLTVLWIIYAVCAAVISAWGSG